MPEAGQQEGEGEELRSFEVGCWACKRTLRAPVNPDTNAPYELVRCGVCHALVDTGAGHDLNVGCVPGRQGAIQQLRRRSTKFGRWLFAFINTFLGVPFVFAACVSVVAIGVTYGLPYAVAPGTPLSYAAHALAYFLGWNTVSNYTMCVFAKVTRAPESVQHPVLQEKGWRDFRFCDKCQRVKPPRAHHCSTCGTCILALDHHCLFTGRCIGHHNHRYFMLFIGWLQVSVWYVMVVVGTACASEPSLSKFFTTVAHQLVFTARSLVGLDATRPPRLQLSEEQVLTGVLLCFEFAISFGTALAVGFLFLGQARQIALGVTQFEYSFEYPLPSRYNLGWRRNWGRVMGTRWFWPPIQPPHGDGMFFEERKNE